LATREGRLLSACLVGDEGVAGPVAVSRRRRCSDLLLSRASKVWSFASETLSFFPLVYRYILFLLGALAQFL
jgi:hypothetical protein